MIGFGGHVRARALALSAVIAVVALTSFAGSASAGDARDIREGEALATKVCSPCHAASKRVGPTFAEIAKEPRWTPEALGDFLRTTHADVRHPNAMPSPELTERQIEEISAYLASLRGAK
jgi:mono/diheme cytochrome c family protein